MNEIAQLVTTRSDQEIAEDIRKKLTKIFHEEVCPILDEASLHNFGVNFEFHIVNLKNRVARIRVLKEL